MSRLEEENFDFGMLKYSAAKSPVESRQPRDNELCRVTNCLQLTSTTLP